MGLNYLSMFLSILIIISGPLCLSDEDSPEETQTLDTQSLSSISQEEDKYYREYSKIHDNYTPKDASFLEAIATSFGLEVSKKDQGYIRKINSNNNDNLPILLDDPIVLFKAKFKNIESDISGGLKLGGGLVNHLNCTWKNFSKECNKSRYYMTFLGAFNIDLGNFQNELNIRYMAKDFNKSNYEAMSNFFANTSYPVTPFLKQISSALFNEINDNAKEDNNEIIFNNSVHTNWSTKYNFKLFNSEIGSFYFYAGGSIGLISLLDKPDMYWISNFPVFGLKYENSFATLSIGSDLIEFSFNIAI